jgi:hypothetical protein
VKKTEILVASDGDVASAATCGPLLLALSDFYLFGKLKMILMGAVFANDELLQGVMEGQRDLARRA